MTILYLTFNFEPDLGPCAFRNTSVVNELAALLPPGDSIHVITCQPNRYRSYKVVAPEHEERSINNCTVRIDRVSVPEHENGFFDQIRSFEKYFRTAYTLAKNTTYDLVVASSSRLFTAFTGAILARQGFKKPKVPLFLDIRDLFREAIVDVLANPLARFVLNPTLWAVEQFTFGSAQHINVVSEGFRSYFDRYPKATYSYFTNGIDDEFLQPPLLTVPSVLRLDRSILGQRSASVRTILYAGNIGEGQGLHKIIPQTARLLGQNYRFVVIGDGGARHKLEKALHIANIKNVDLRRPINRKELLEEYQRADYLFVHLNDLKACERVLPSKLFEYGATDKPILAGVSGYSASFVKAYLKNSIVFASGDAESLVSQLRSTPYVVYDRADFRAKFRRKAISRGMAEQIVTTLYPTSV